MILMQFSQINEFGFTKINIYASRAFAYANAYIYKNT